MTKTKLFSTESVEKKQTLLQKAKTTTGRRKKFDFSDEELELVQAWLNEEISFKQVMTALDKSTGITYTFLAVGARWLWNMNNK